MLTIVPWCHQKCQSLKVFFQTQLQFETKSEINFSPSLLWPIHFREMGRSPEEKNGNTSDHPTEIRFRWNGERKKGLKGDCIDNSGLGLQKNQNPIKFANEVLFSEIPGNGAGRSKSSIPKRNEKNLFFSAMPNFFLVSDFSEELIRWNCPIIPNLSSRDSECGETPSGPNLWPHQVRKSWRNFTQFFSVLSALAQFFLLPL